MSDGEKVQNRQKMLFLVALVALLLVAWSMVAEKQENSLDPYPVQKGIYYNQSGLIIQNVKLKTMQIPVVHGQIIVLYGNFSGVSTYGIYTDEHGNYVSSIQDHKNSFLTAKDFSVRALIIPSDVRFANVNLLTNEEYVVVSETDSLLNQDHGVVNSSFEDSLFLYNAFPAGKHIPGSYHHHQYGFLGNPAMAWYPPINVSGFTKLYFDDFADEDGGLTYCGTWYDENWSLISTASVERSQSSAILDIPEDAEYFIPTIEISIIDKSKLFRVREESTFYINSEFVYSPKREYPLQGKTWVSFGDSITAQNAWQPFVIRQFDMNHINLGTGSACMAGDGHLALHKESYINDIKRVNPDIITILVGANDIRNPKITIGNQHELDIPITEKDTDTFIGAYSKLVETLLVWKPSLRVFILGTGYAHNNGIDVRPTESTLTYKDFSDASRLVANYYGLPFVDLYGEAGFNKLTMGDDPYNVYSNDRIHPNTAGARRIAELIIGCFERTMTLP